MCLLYFWHACLTWAHVQLPHEHCDPCLLKQLPLQKASVKDAALTKRDWWTATLSNLTRHCVSHWHCNGAAETGGPVEGGKKKWDKFVAVVLLRLAAPFKGYHSGSYASSQQMSPNHRSQHSCSFSSVKKITRDSSPSTQPCMHSFLHISCTLSVALHV